jgi:hypothetical protein
MERMKDGGEWKIVRKEERKKGRHVHTNHNQLTFTERMKEYNCNRQHDVWI